MTIVWGKTQKIEFDGPYSIQEWEPSEKGGIYCIMKRGSKERSYIILYFGESENLAKRILDKLHQAYPCWLKEAGSENNLFLGVYLMPNSSKEEREKIENDLIEDYKPVCNEDLN